MKIMVDLDTLGVNGKGEALRNLVFNQKWNKRYGFKERGCYDTFEVNDGFEKIEPEKYPQLKKIAMPRIDNDDEDVYEGITLHAYESAEIVAMWYWDGDGYLLIWIKGEKYACDNTDCKCDYTWHTVLVEGEN